MVDSPTVDLNADLGESFGAYTLGADLDVMKLISSANIACAMHAGDPRIMDESVQMSRDAGIAIGAHPGFPDLVGFGRRALDSHREAGIPATSCRAGSFDGPRW